MRNTHCRTWNMARKLKRRENEKDTSVRHEIRQETLKNVENEKCTLQDLEYGQKTEYRGK